MSAVLPAPGSKVVEDLHPAPDASVDEEIVDLSTPASAPAAAPAVVKPAAAPAAPAAAAADDEIPEEFRGKSPKELVRMYREAQSTIGRQGSELGDFRKKADMLIQASLASLAAGRAQRPAAEPAAAATAPATAA